MRKYIFFSVMAAMFNCLLIGCQRQFNIKQENWHQRLSRGAYVVSLLADHNVPLLLEEQLLAIVGYRPDLKVHPLELAALVKDDDPYLSRCVEDMWTSYLDARGLLDQVILGQVNGAELTEGWQDSDAFKQSTLWVYEESYHFDKPPHKGDLLYCLFCLEPRFKAYIFFIEDGKVFGETSITHELPLSRLEGR